jgi:hypothetical protein
VNVFYRRRSFSYVSGMMIRLAICKKCHKDNVRAYEYMKTLSQAGDGKFVDPETKGESGYAFGNRSFTLFLDLIPKSPNYLHHGAFCRGSGFWSIIKVFSFIFSPVVQKS